MSKPVRGSRSAGAHVGPAAAPRRAPSTGASRQVPNFAFVVADVSLRGQPSGRATRLACQALPKPWAEKTGRLVLEDGTVLKGRCFGASGSKVAEIVFNTSLSGYQEIMTDPSYRDQMVCFTYPHIGNTGINDGAQ
jgi:Carbamoyl-phosphate synthase small chain, CPSase domain